MLRIAPRSACDHRGDEEGAQIDNGLDVGPHHCELGGAVGPRHRTHRGEAGVVDEDVDAEPARLDLSGQLAAGVGVGEVGCDHLGADLVGDDQLVGERLEPVFAAGDQGDAVAAPRELPGDFGADTGRGAGHDGGGVLFGGGEGHGVDRR